MYSLLLAVSLVLVTASSSPKPDGAKAPTILEALDWLPSDTETIVVTRGPFKVEVQDEKEREEWKVDKALESFALSLLCQGSYVKPLKGSVVTLTLEGARGFRSPAGLGLMPYDGCHIIIFERDLGSGGANFVKALKSDASKVETIAKQEVFVFKKKAEQDQWTFFIAHPRPNILLAATDSKYLEEVLKRMAMKDKPKTRALPENLPEWKHVDLNARYWGIRHYDKGNAAQDPSSPLVKETRPANNPDLQAIGFVFTLDPVKENVARMKYLSGNERAGPIAAGSWTHPEEELVPKVIEKTKGVVEISVELKKQRTRGAFLLVLLAALGHGIYI